MDRDINDVFDDILLTEERAVEEAYEEGHLQGEQEGKCESKLPLKQKQMLFE